MFTLPIKGNLEINSTQRKKIVFVNVIPILSVVSLLRCCTLQGRQTQIRTVSLLLTFKMIGLLTRLCSCISLRNSIISVALIDKVRSVFINF